MDFYEYIIFGILKAVVLSVASYALGESFLVLNWQPELKYEPSYYLSCAAEAALHCQETR